ncbi:MAG: peptidoglycan-binding protein [Blastocatellia bacterium]
MKLGVGKARLVALLMAVSTILPLFNYAYAYNSDSGSYTNNQRNQEVRAGTILKLSMDTYLTSRTAAIGDPFTATVFDDVRINGAVLIPKGAKIEGKVSSVKAAERKSKSGTLGIDFDRLRLPNGQVITVEGQLASLDTVEQKQIDEEGRVSGGSSSKRNVVFIGGGAAGGAAIGAIAGGGSGAAIGAGVGAAAGILGSIFSKGEEAQVMNGQKFGMELLRTVIVPDASANNDRDRFNDRDPRNNDRDDRDRFGDRDPRNNSNNQNPLGSNLRTADLKSQVVLKRAQKALLDLNYYKGPLNGINGPSTRTAIRAFQRDYDLQQTGDLDLDTAYQLGLVNEDGIEILPVRILNATADRQRDSIRVKASAETNSGGWQIYTSTQVDGDQLHVYITGAPPFGGASQALTKYPVEVPAVRDDNNIITRVIVHGEGTPVTISLASASLELAQRLKQQTASMVEGYKESTGVTRRGRREFNVGRLTEAQAVTLSTLSNLSNTASFVELLLTSRASEAGLKGAVQSLVRESRQAKRIIERNREFYLVEKAWFDLEKDIRALADNYRIGFDNNQD